MDRQNIPKPRWVQAVLGIAAAFHLVVGLLLTIRPLAIFTTLGLAAPLHPIVMQAVGIFYMVLGIGFGIASLHPVRHWSTILVGLAGKVFTPVLMITSSLTGTISSAWLWTIAADIIWWVPLALALFVVWYHLADTTDPNEEETLEELLERHTSQRGASIAKLSAERPLLLVFARHAGCTFCREMLSDLSEQRARLEALGLEIGVVHMSSPLEATKLAIRYELDGLHMFEDQHCELYEAFGLQRGSVLQLFGPKVWVRGLWAGVVEGHGLGAMQGDGFRLQGAFIIDKGEIVTACRGQTAADQIDFVALAKASRRLRNSGVESHLAGA